MRCNILFIKILKLIAVSVTKVEAACGQCKEIHVVVSRNHNLSTVAAHLHRQRHRSLSLETDRTWDSCTTFMHQKFAVVH
eukprot:m.336998 g.336998  ORF g.336998 m.336998 type:complete len:80 (+) comp20543_c0_seq18:204-443(+)